MLEEQQKLVDYWASLPVGLDGIPLKKYFQPSAIANILSNVYLVKAEGDFPVSLVGTELERYAGMVLSGISLKAMSGPMFNLYEEKARAMFAGPVGSASVILGHSLSGISYRVESLALPMRGADGEQFVVGHIGTPEKVEDYSPDSGAVELIRFEKTEMIALPVSTKSAE